MCFCLFVCLFVCLLLLCFRKRLYRPVYTCKKNAIWSVGATCTFQIISSNHRLFILIAFIPNLRSKQLTLSMIILRILLLQLLQSVNPV